jgi:hypothetical protein
MPSIFSAISKAKSLLSMAQEPAIKKNGPLPKVAKVGKFML